MEGAIPIHDGRDLTVGDDVLALGYPMAMDLWDLSVLTVSKGIVSGFVRHDEGFMVSDTQRFRDVSLILTDAAINRGNSGGPLVIVRNGRIEVTFDIDRRPRVHSGRTNPNITALSA